MKIHGQKPTLPVAELVVLPRGEGQLVFKLGPILNTDEFDKLCPQPLPPMGQKLGEEPRPMFNDSEYLAKVQLRALRRFEWMMVTSLNYTDGLEWESVKMTEPDTWTNWKDELVSCGLLTSEINRIQEAFYVANSLSEAKLKEARDRFLSLQAAHKAQ